MTSGSRSPSPTTSMMRRATASWTIRGRPNRSSERIISSNTSPMSLVASGSKQPCEISGWIMDMARLSFQRRDPDFGGARECRPSCLHLLRLCLLGELDPGLRHFEQERLVSQIGRAARQAQALGGTMLIALGCWHPHPPWLSIQPLTREGVHGSRHSRDFLRISLGAPDPASRRLVASKTTIAISDLQLII